MTNPKHLYLVALIGGAALIACIANAAEPRDDELDRRIDEHPYIGKLYIQSFEAGVRIPPEFRGEWSNEIAICGTDKPNEGNRILVRAVTFHFYDETHVVTKVRRLGPSSLALTYGPLIRDYHFFIAPPVISLSPDGKMLQGWEDPSRKKRQGRWSRCPQVSR